MMLAQLSSSGTQTAPAARRSRIGITACICTRDRSELLARALRSILAQSRPADDILVVDNAPRN
ncbi:MAG TPA: hypothetical protein VJ596_10910, partial [Gemmatimonadaceae bacterium]|nr:hypothetical protein [Gemmatimonadaceae bacterium]